MRKGREIPWRARTRPCTFVRACNEGTGSHRPSLLGLLHGSPRREAGLHRAFLERSRIPVEGRRRGAMSVWLEPWRLHVVLWSVPFVSPASAPLRLPPRRSNPLPRSAKNSGQCCSLSLGASGAFRPQQRLGGRVSRPGARSEERRLAATPPSRGHHFLGSRPLVPCPPVTRSEWAERSREEAASLRSSRSRFGPVKGRDGSPLWSRGGDA